MALAAKAQTAGIAAVRAIAGAMMFVPMRLLGRTALEAMGRRLLRANELDQMLLHRDPAQTSAEPSAICGQYILKDYNIQYNERFLDKFHIRI